MTVFIGDVHGYYRSYKRILSKHKNTIQVGDMGVGFRKYLTGDEHDPWSVNPPYDKMVKGGHRFIRGNHDNPGVCRNHTQWIPDGHAEGDMMFIGGGLSIDREYRIEGYSYWPDEELSQSELERLLEVYAERKPRVMVTHECPEEIAMRMLHRTEKLEFPSITRQMFQKFWREHQPELWVYGHWHMSFDMEADGTRFVCLDELEVREIE